jgi:hydrogenase/urease accessory protein HupE
MEQFTLGFNADTGGLLIFLMLIVKHTAGRYSETVRKVSTGFIDFGMGLCIGWALFRLYLTITLIY